MRMYKGIYLFYVSILVCFPALARLTSSSATKLTTTASQLTDIAQVQKILKQLQAEKTKRGFTYPNQIRKVEQRLAQLRKTQPKAVPPRAEPQEIAQLQAQLKEKQAELEQAQQACELRSGEQDQQINRLQNQIAQLQKQLKTCQLRPVVRKAPPPPAALKPRPGPPSGPPPGAPKTKPQLPSRVLEQIRKGTPLKKAKPATKPVEKDDLLAQIRTGKKLKTPQPTKQPPKKDPSFESALEKALAGRRQALSKDEAEEEGNEEWEDD